MTGKERNTQREAHALQAVRFIDKNVAGIALGIEDELLNANCFSKLLRGYTAGVIAPYVMRGLLPISAIRVSLDVVVPSPKGLTPEKWKQTATFRAFGSSFGSSFRFKLPVAEHNSCRGESGNCVVSPGVGNCSGVLLLGRPD